MNGGLLEVLDSGKNRAVKNVREAVNRIWSRPLHRYYTDHTVDHSERVIALLDGLTEGMMATDNRLCPTEVFVLLAAAYLHDIGMQNERFAEGDLEDIRAIHHEIAAEMIYAVFEDPANAFAVPLARDPGPVEAIALVSRGHRKVDLSAPEFNPLTHGNETIRLRLLAALLRFADELDIDHRRVDLEQMKLMNVPDDSKLHWWKCHYVSGVSIEDGYIRVTYRFPRDRPGYEDLIVPLVETDIREKLADLEEILWVNGVKVALGKPQVRMMRLVQPLPLEVEDLARQGKTSVTPPPSKPEPGPATPAREPQPPQQSSKYQINIGQASGLAIGDDAQVIHQERKIDTGGGTYVEGPVNTGGGDFVAGNQTTHIHDVDGSVSVGGGEAVDARHSQGMIYKPSGPVTQHFGDKITVVQPPATAPPQQEPTGSAPVPSREYVDVEIRILPQQPDGYPIDITLNGQQQSRGYLSTDAVSGVSGSSRTVAGGKLFDALFAGGELREAWGRAKGKDIPRHMRLWLDVDVPELHKLPWELMQEDEVMLAASADTPFSRYLPDDSPWGGAVKERPIRVLAVISNPEDLVDSYNLPSVDVVAEREILESALADVGEDEIKLEFLEAPVTLEKLETKLREGYHVLHFVGHGAFSTRRRQAVIYLQDEDGYARLVRDNQLVRMLARLGTRPELITLIACQSATRSTADAFAGLGPKLVKIGVPAVLAMQDAVMIDTARKFESTFYQRLLEHGYVDLAANEARGTLLTAGRSDAAAPVLFMRLKDGQLFVPAASGNMTWNE